MKRKHFDYIVPKSLGRGDDEDEEDEKEREDKRDDLVMLNKKLEKIFFEKRSIYLWGVVDDKSAREVTTKMMLLEYDKPGDEIKFYINSPGGVVTSGMVMYDTMRMIKSPVTTICMGLAASMGSILLSGGVKGKRYIYPHGEVMIHQPSLGGHIRGVSADLEIQAEQTRRVKEIGARILAENCGKSIEQIMRDFDRDYWMDADQALAYGIVDKKIDKL
jgi:ATP-dependent Clp protease protease subunit